MSGALAELTKATFDDAVKAGVTLVDFWAPWCPPCRAQTPILEAVAPKLAGRAAVAKVNVDEQGDLAARFSVASIPTLVLFKDGKEARRLTGLQQADELVTAVEALL